MSVTNGTDTIPNVIQASIDLCLRYAAEAEAAQVAAAVAASKKPRS